MDIDPNKDLWPGKRVLWRHKPRGGYGYVMRVPVTVRMVRGRKVSVELEDGRKVAVARSSIIQPDTMRHVVPILEPKQEK